MWLSGDNLGLTLSWGQAFAGRRRPRRPQPRTILQDGEDEDRPVEAWRGPTMMKGLTDF